MNEQPAELRKKLLNTTPPQPFFLNRFDFIPPRCMIVGSMSKLPEIRRTMIAAVEHTETFAWSRGGGNLWSGPFDPDEYKLLLVKKSEDNGETYGL